MTPRPCRYCQQPFLPADRASRRRYCYAAECEVAQEVFRRAFIRARRDALRRGEAPAEDASLGYEPIPAARRARRTCLRCEAPFWSPGAHRRICPACRATRDWRRAGIGVAPVY
jgi:hypothetical protein